MRYEFWILSYKNRVIETELEWLVKPNKAIAFKYNQTHPSKENTSFTGEIEEHSGELLQCRLTGHTARSHFSLPGSRRNKHRHAGRRAQPLHSHVLKPQPTIRRVRHALGQARRCGSTVSHHDHHSEASRSLSDDSVDSLDMGSPEWTPYPLSLNHEDDSMELSRRRKWDVSCPCLWAPP